MDVKVDTATGVAVGSERPKLTARYTIRLPQELIDDLALQADHRRCSVNEVILNALENELARLWSYRLDFYADIRPLAHKSLNYR